MAARSKIGSARSVISSLPVTEMRKRPGISTTAPGRTYTWSSREPLDERDVVRDRARREQVERPLGGVEVVAVGTQRLHEEVAASLQRLDVHAHALQVAHRALQDVGRRRVASEGELPEHQRLAHLGAVGHLGRQGDVADPLTGREQLLGVGVDQERVRVELGRARERPVVEQDPRVRLVRDQVDRVPDAFGAGGEHVGQRAKGLGRVDLAARVVRRVHDDRRGAFGDRRLDRVEVEVPGLVVHGHPDGVRLAAEDDRLVEEPRGREEDHLVAGVGHRSDAQVQAGERAVGHQDVVGLVRHAPSLAQAGRGGLLRVRLVELVRVPVLVLRHGPALQRLDELRERHLLGVAGDEVAHGGVGRVAVGVPALVEEASERRLDLPDALQALRQTVWHRDPPSLSSAARGWPARAWCVRGRAPNPITGRVSYQVTTGIPSGSASSYAVAPNRARSVLASSPMYETGSTAANERSCSRSRRTAAGRMYGPMLSP